VARVKLSQSEMADIAERIIKNRFAEQAGRSPALKLKESEEGGCGVVGFACTIPVRGRHVFKPCIQMHNRGNGKGGGIACAGLDPQQMGVDADILRDDYILQIALLDAAAENEVEAAHIAPYFDIHHKVKVETKADHRELGLDPKPPDVVRYFVRVKKDVLAGFAEKAGLADAAPRQAEDEFVFGNSARLNDAFYTSLGDKRAFVLSHARDLLILKIVGYAEHVVQYYGMEDFKAQVWIAHQRYPTKGRVWHPGGSHPFIGLNEALVHNGDFANYLSVCEYLKQHGITTQFLTDTEVSVLLFDLWTRIYGYPLEYVIEAMAPTTELDFNRLPREKQVPYRAIQSMHMHGSPDGPWFFIIARSEPDQGRHRLLGITDTAMLRPQVFALQEGDVSIGLVASEKQAIDATLNSLSQEDPRFRQVADRYWNARGGSATDGGAFIFTVANKGGSSAEFVCTDKFGRAITAPAGEWRFDPAAAPQAPGNPSPLAGRLKAGPSAATAAEVFGLAAAEMADWDFDNLRWFLAETEAAATRGEESLVWALEILTLLNDRRYHCGNKKRSMALQLIRLAIDRILDKVPGIAAGQGGRFCRIDWQGRDKLRAPQGGEQVLVINAREFAAEGEDCEARLTVKAYQLGWRRFIVYGLKGQRFSGCGLGPATQGARLDVYGSSGDYLASGIDGLEILVHNNGQDQLGQIMKQGRLVVYGDVGQAFMYGAKGGEVYVMGNAAGRPLINAAGRPRVVINGTCLDFLAESFMAGDPLNGGGFVVLNGMEFDDQGQVRAQEIPYPGANLFSLASGGAIYARDPHKKLITQQLNGGQFFAMTDADWNLILPYLEANERLFGISVERDLLTVDGARRSPLEVYRKVGAVKLDVLSKVAVPE